VRVQSRSSDYDFGEVALISGGGRTGYRSLRAVETPISEVLDVRCAVQRRHTSGDTRMMFCRPGVLVFVVAAGAGTTLGTAMLIASGIP